MTREQLQRYRKHTRDVERVSQALARLKRQDAPKTEDIEAYISSVEDPKVREIMELRFLRGMTWLQVAMRVGGDNTADSVRMACNRYLNEN